MIELECTRRFGKVFCSRDDTLEQSQVAATKLTIQIIWSFYCAASYAIRAFSSYILLDQYSARFRGQKRETHDCAAAALRDDTVFARSPFDDKLELRVSDPVSFLSPVSLSRVGCRLVGARRTASSASFTAIWVTSRSLTSFRSGLGHIRMSASVLILVANTSFHIHSLCIATELTRGSIGWILVQRRFCDVFGSPQIQDDPRLLDAKSRYDLILAHGFN